MLITLLLAYSLGISYYLVVKHRSQKANNDLDRIWKKAASTPNPSATELRSIAQLAKARQTEIPWYERSLSTIGIVAFFSMLIATSFQTINSAKTEIESTNLKQEIKGLEAQRASWKDLMKKLSEVVLLKQAGGMALENSEADVLRQRLGEINRGDQLSKEDDIEKLRILLALKEYDSASALIERSTFLNDEASPEILLLLSEASFLDGAYGRAKSLLTRIEPELSKQRVDWQLRFFVLNAALASDYDPYVNQVAALKRVSLSEANEWLKGKVAELKEQAARRHSLSATPSPG